jgi:hypothetical protein
VARGVVCAVVAVLLGCQQNARTEASLLGEAQSPGLPPASTDARQGVADPRPPDEAPRQSSCRRARAVWLRPRVVASEWPSRLGQRVLLRVRPERAVAVGETVVAAEGQRFLVLASPGALLTGTHTFVVVGSASVRLGGRVQLPQLVLDDDCSS